MQPCSPSNYGLSFLVFYLAIQCLSVNIVYRDLMQIFPIVKGKLVMTVCPNSILIIVYACVIVVLYRVDIEVMSRAGFKWRAPFVVQGV